jgi:hypothetical protein
MDEFDDNEDGMNLEEFEGDVDATSVMIAQIDMTSVSDSQCRILKETRTSVFNVWRHKQILDHNSAHKMPNTVGYIPDSTQILGFAGWSEWDEA